MIALDSYAITCPYCGQLVDMLVDISIGDQEYVEDCPVCCRPIILTVNIGTDSRVSIGSRTENE